MPRTFQRPDNLPNDIPIYNITARDADADLILKVTALATNKSAVIPTYKEEMTELLPTYFGMIFDKNKGYEFRENRLQPGEYFEIEIPNLEEPENVAIFLKKISDDKLVQGELSSQISDAAKKLLIGCYDWPEFYWIANYFNESPLLLDILEHLLRGNQNFCHELLINYPIDNQFKEKIITAIRNEEFKDPR